MNKTSNNFWRFLYTWSGEDNSILKTCNEGIQNRFALIGFFVLTIFVGCFLSASFFTYNLFEGARWISLPIGLIWSAMLVNIYLLLLYTISPAIIPLASKKKKVIENNHENDQGKGSFYTFSMFSRIAFMMLLAIIIAQPLNVFLLSKSVQTSIEKHKIQESVKLYTLTNSHLIKEELQNQKDLNQKIKNRLNSNDALIISNHLQILNDKISNDEQFIIIASKKLTQLDKIDCHIFLNKKEKLKKETIINELAIHLENELSSDRLFIDNINSMSILGDFKTDYNEFKTNLSTLVKEKLENYDKLNCVLNKSNFYIKTIQLLLIENPFSWIVTLAICLIFLIPIYLKYKARDVSANIFKSKEHEPNIIRLREELINTKDFNWLEKKIKTVNSSEIRITDYYFQRMLIEHKIILEEYDITKKIFSEKLTLSIKNYNHNSFTRLLPLLEKLKKVDFSKYQELSTQIIKEYKDEVVVKYEYWLDMPFRTKRVHTVTITNNEVGLLDFVYNQPEKDETNSQI